MISKDIVSEVNEYIKGNWKNCIRKASGDDGYLLKLPFPYTVPCTKGIFRSLFYWDTYFTNLGLIRQGLGELAKNNTDNLLYEVSTYGNVLNSNTVDMKNRSQPPYLSMMVRDIYDITKDQEWLEEAYRTLKKEYDFWMTQRITHIGLNRHFHNATDWELKQFYSLVHDRIKLTASYEEEKISTGSQFLSEGETGWDFTPRFNGRGADFIPVDLNSNLLIYEKNFAYFSSILGNDEECLWTELAAKRVELMNHYCWNEEAGLFMDYDYVKGNYSNVASLASYHPLWAGAATYEQAEKTLDNLERFEYNYGLASCELGPRTTMFQWDYPNGWPPLHFIVINALMNYGFTKDAKRIAQKYVTTVTRNFMSTGDLWEKYNVVEGTTNVADEYEMPKMMGWTAGVFIYATEFLESK